MSPMRSHVSPMSYSSSVFRQIVQAGGGGQGQGELWRHDVVCCVLCVIVYTDYLFNLLALYDCVVIIQ